MLPDTFNGLPLHPLSVHATVVLVPLAGLLGVLFAVPRLRCWARVPLALIALAAAGAVWVSTQSGAALKEAGGIGAAGLGGPVAELVERHEELAEQLQWLVWAYAVVAVVAVGFAWRSDPARTPAHDRTGEGAADGAPGPGLPSPPVVGVLSALLVLGAVGMGVQVYRVGDIGSQAVWNPAGTTDYSVED